MRISPPVSKLAIQFWFGLWALWMALYPAGGVPSRPMVTQLSWATSGKTSKSRELMLVPKVPPRGS